MTVYVDDLFNWPGKGVWCHMATDGEPSELHEMAAKIGLKRHYFQGVRKGKPHYDLRESKRALAINHGAREVSATTLYRECFKRKEQ